MVTDLHGDAAAQPARSDEPAPTAQELQAAQHAELLEALTAPEDPARRRWPHVVLAVVLVLAGLGATYTLRDTGPTGPPHPSAWDPEVQAYVDFVEKARDLAFVHPVYVDFLTDEEFERQVTGDRDELTAEDEAELARSAGMLRALGLVEGDVDLFEESDELYGASVVGFYSYADERLRIRGTELTPAVESTLVHELTHALQDQHFDLGKRRQQLRDADDATSAAAGSGFDALVEGDARRIEAAWRDALSPKQQRALAKDRAKGSERAEKKASDAPDVLTTQLLAPYELGQALLAVAVQQGGERAVDDLFRSPPRTEEQQLDPWTLVVDHQGFLTVPAPELAEGEEELGDGGAFGAVGWLTVLSQRLPAKDALAAVDGWGGDSYRTFERAGVTCVRASYRADTDADLAQMFGALQTWAARTPRAPVSVAREQRTVLFESCDPGRHAPKVAKGRSGDALGYALARTYLSLGLLEGGATTVAEARCAAGRLVDELTLAQLGSTTYRPKPERVAAALRPCRPGA